MIQLLIKDVGPTAHSRRFYPQIAKTQGTCKSTGPRFSFEFLSICISANFQPFVVGVDFGFGETTTATSATAINDEQKVHPSGAVGFHINFAQDTI